MPTAGVAISMRKITRFACGRIARRAFELARSRRRRVAAAVLETLDSPSDTTDIG